MSAARDVYGDAYQAIRLQALWDENRHLRAELKRRGVDPDLIARGVAQARRRKPRKRA